MNPLVRLRYGGCDMGETVYICDYYSGSNESGFCPVHLLPLLIYHYFAQSC